MQFCLLVCLMLLQDTDPDNSLCGVHTHMHTCTQLLSLFYFAVNSAWILQVTNETLQQQECI